MSDEPGQCPRWPLARAGLTLSITQAPKNTVPSAREEPSNPAQGIHCLETGNWDQPRTLPLHPRRHRRVGAQWGHPTRDRARLPSIPSCTSPAIRPWLCQGVLDCKLTISPVPAPSAENELLGLESVQLCSSACRTPRADKPLNHFSPRCQAT